MQRKIILFVISTHFLLICLALFDFPSSHKKNITAKLLVRTVSLHQERIQQNRPLQAAPEPEITFAQTIPQTATKKQRTEKKPQKKAQTKTSPVTKKKSAKKKNSKKPTHEKEKEENLLAEITASLQQAEKLRSTKKAACANTIDTPEQIGTLQTESSITVDEQTTLTSQEQQYVQELILLLKRSLLLPEYGEVKVELCIARNGKVRKVSILSSKSKKNRTYIEKMLPSVHFAAFGSRFEKEEEHLFLLNLSNEVIF